VTLIRLALASLVNRRVAAGLTIISIALSVALLLTVEHLRRDARSAFANTVSGTDLIVGAPIGDVQLLLQTIFRIGHSGGGVTWERFESVRNDPRVAWAVPIALGDSYQGYPVIGTTQDYFEHYKVGRRQTLKFGSGAGFSQPSDAVIGADVASSLDLNLGQSLILAHGRGEIETEHHDDAPFTVTGILARTGTPVDRAIHVSLAGVARVHGPRVGQGDALSALQALQQGHREHGHEKEAAEHKDHEQGDAHELPVNAFLVGLKRKIDLLGMQRALNETKSEPLQAVIPGVALQQLWDIFSVAEDLLRFMSWLVVLAGLVSMLIVIVATLEARRHEMAMLRAVGASPAYVGSLFLAEAGVLAAIGIAVGVLFKYLAQIVLSPWVAQRFGVQLPQSMLTGEDGLLLLLVWIAALLVALLPAWRAMRLALTDGLLVRG